MNQNYNKKELIIISWIRYEKKHITTKTINENKIIIINYILILNIFCLMCFGCSLEVVFGGLSRNWFVGFFCNYNNFCLVRNWCPLSRAVTIGKLIINWIELFFNDISQGSNGGDTTSLHGYNISAKGMYWSFLFKKDLCLH